MPSPAKRQEREFINKEAAKRQMKCAVDSVFTSVLPHHVEILQVKLFAHPGVVREVVHGEAHHIQT